MAAFRPCDESAQEGGASHLIPSPALAVTRALSAGALGTLAALALTRPHDRALFTALGTAVSFALLAVASLLLPCDNAGRIVSRIAAPVHLTAAACALRALLPPRAAWMAASGDALRLALAVAPAALVVADFGLGAKLHFRLTYAALPVLGAAACAVARGDGVKEGAVEVALVAAGAVGAVILSCASMLCVREQERKIPPAKLDRDFLSCRQDSDGSESGSGV